VAPWLTVAKSYVGLKEIPGKLHNPTIIGWLKRFALNIGRWGKNRDETPWCSVYVSHCLEAVGLKSTRDARAVSYATYGRPSKFRAGAIIVIRRKRKGPNVTGSNRGGYHVAFLLENRKNWYKVVGGNQRNGVSIASYSKKNYELIALRWPGPDEGWNA
jgi:uncharacterized protein (TIGR02594 family)